MNKLKYATLATLFAAGIANASTPCDGFKIEVQNNLPFDMAIHKIHLDGAEIQPGTIHQLNQKSEETFTVNKSVDNGVMKGEIILNTISLPSKKVHISFNLVNSGDTCVATDVSNEVDLTLTKSFPEGKIHYEISQ
ncbi:MAG: hypothetical protein H0U70_05460 [Tatlockia sp.]|nr:hypothetical protein [Tatlockia sp.]